MWPTFLHYVIFYHLESGLFKTFIFLVHKKQYMLSDICLRASAWITDGNASSVYCIYNLYCMCVCIYVRINSVYLNICKRVHVLYTIIYGVLEEQLSLSWPQGWMCLGCGGREQTSVTLWVLNQWETCLSVGLCDLLYIANENDHSCFSRKRSSGRIYIDFLFLETCVWADICVFSIRW